MEFTLRELEHFLAVAEELNFARAARRVGIAATNLSKAMRKLEQNMGVQLLVTDNKSTRLTVAGETLKADAKRILQEVTRTHRNVAVAASGRRGKLRVGVAGELAIARMARLFAESREDDPELQLSIVQRTWAEQKRELRADLIDIGFVTGPTSEEPASLGEVDRDIVLQLLWEDRQLVALRADSPLVEDDEVEFQDLSQRFGPVMFPLDRGSEMMEVILKRLAIAGGFEYVPTVELLLMLVAAGQGVGIVSAGYTEGLTRVGVVFRPVTSLFTPVSVATYAMRRRNDESPHVLRLMERAQRMT